MLLTLALNGRDFGGPENLASTGRTSADVQTLRAGLSPARSP
jgi:hypothetical protein